MNSLTHIEAEHTQDSCNGVKSIVVGYCVIYIIILAYNINTLCLERAHGTTALDCKEPIWISYIFHDVQMSQIQRHWPPYLLM